MDSHFEFNFQKHKNHTQKSIWRYHPQIQRIQFFFSTESARKFSNKITFKSSLNHLTTKPQWLFWTNSSKNRRSKCRLLLRAISSIFELKTLANQFQIDPTLQIELHNDATKISNTQPTSNPNFQISNDQLLRGTRQGRVSNLWLGIPQTQSRFKNNYQNPPFQSKTAALYQDDMDYEWKYKYSKICGIKNKS